MPDKSDHTDIKVTMKKLTLAGHLAGSARGREFLYVPRLSGGDRVCTETQCFLIKRLVAVERLIPLFLFCYTACSKESRVSHAGIVDFFLFPPCIKSWALCTNSFPRFS